MKKIIIFLFIVLLISIGAYFWWQNGIASVDLNDASKKTIVVRAGEGTREIISDLKKQGLIRDPIVAFLLMKKMGIEGKIQAGVFYLSSSMTAGEILQNLQTGKFDIAITIPEGKRAEEIADTLKHNYTGFTEEWRAKLNSQEGYLFPDTYYFPRDASIEQIIGIMRKNFDKKYAEVINNTPLTQGEIVVIASMIEREARHAQDRSLVSSVIHNRLNIGMKLDIDATVQYSLGYDPAGQTWWKKNLTAEDLHVNSVYNTYNNAGLPPGPICNPGLASLIAAANPGQTEYLYYLTDKNGVNHYASTLEEHNQNIQKYRE